MNLIKTILLSSLATLLFTACSDDTTNVYTDSNSTDKTINNSLLADDENQYGYFGEYVIFGDERIAGYWVIENIRNGDSQAIEFFGDGEGAYADTSDATFFDYGISNDGKTITTSYGALIEFIQTYEVFIGQDGNGNKIYTSCFIVSYEQRFATDKVEMCGTGYTVPLN